MELSSSFKLPPDIVGQILQRLDPVDILAMRATCRMFYRAAASRNVWMAALVRVCEEHGIYKGTYPLEKMTLAELEHAASGPHRFIKFIDDVNKPAERAIDEYYGGIEHISLVPGGRFLFTASTHPVATVCLWDLGYNMHAPVKPFPLATTPFDGGIILNISAFPSSDGRLLRIAVLEVPSGTDTSASLGLYLINAACPTPKFQLEREQKLIENPTRYDRSYMHCSGPIVVLKYQKSIYVWNWAEGKGCRWGYPDLDETDFSLCGQTIITLNVYEDFVIWDIPEALPTAHSAQFLPTITHLPKRIGRRTGGDDGNPEVNLVATSSWQQHVPPHICLAADEEQASAINDRTAFLYAVRNMGDHDKAFFPSYLPVAGGVCARLASRWGDDVTRAISPLFLCDGQLIFCSRTCANELVASLLPVPTEAYDGPIEPRSMYLVEATNADEVSFDPYNVGFCPMSGRVVHLHNSPGGVMEPNPHFKLPPDIVGYVLQHLDPVDILAMRATCRMFYRAAGSRSVWMAALDAVCDQHGIYKPTYPLGKMTLAELEHAALGPRRFISFVERTMDTTDEGGIQACGTRWYPCRKMADRAGQGDGLYNVTRLALVPGGRFLITAARARGAATEGNACIWDLGYNLHSQIKPFPIATTPVYGYAIYDVSAFPSSDVRQLRITVLGVPPSGNEMRLAVYSIDPTSRFPRFKLEGEQRMGGMVNPHVHYNEPIVVVKSEAFVHVWNWVEGKGCRWYFSGLDTQSNILFCGRTIVSVDNNHDFVIWDIPETLPPADSAQELTTVLNYPKRICWQHDAGIEDLPERYLVATPSWQRHTPPHLCLTLDEEEMAPIDIRFYLFAVPKIGEREGAFLPAYLPTMGGKSSTLTEGSRTAIVSPSRRCSSATVD
ncbi:hypothetical protein NMY22_g9131 [Coprinellus aureogranulatus]|nr:hypothetical protein NMY22_g9131 [Coprinellus aureogranulatus]